MLLISNHCEMLREVYPRGMKGILRGVYPERSEWAQNDKRMGLSMTFRPVFHQLIRQLEIILF